MTGSWSRGDRALLYIGRRWQPVVVAYTSRDYVYVARADEPSDLSWGALASELRQDCAQRLLAQVRRKRMTK